jgi:hypothetical protein
VPLVQTTIFQDPIEVPDDEVETLRQQGLLVGEAPAPAGDAAPAAPAAPAAAADKPAGPGAGEKPDAKESKA